MKVQKGISLTFAGEIGEKVAFELGLKELIVCGKERRQRQVTMENS